MKYERLTTRKVVALLKIIDEKSVTVQSYLRLVQSYLRLAEIEDMIERGEIISTQLKDSSEQELKFFAEHNKNVRRLFADELKARLQDAVTLGNITRKVYDVIESEIHYCLGEVKNERLQEID